MSRIALLNVCAAGVLWGTGGVVVTVLHDRTGIGALTASAWRTILAAGVLLLYAVLTGRRQSVIGTFRADPLSIVAVGMGTAAYQAFYFTSVLLVGVSVATVVSLGLAPLLAAAWEHATARTRPALREFAVLVAALAGLLLVSANAGQVSSAPGGRPVPGLILAAIAGAVYAATTLLGRSLATRIDAAELTTSATTVGAVAFAPVLAVAAATGEPVLPTDPVSLALLGYLGVGSMALAYGLLYAGLRSVTGSAATVATLLEAVSAALLAALFLGETLTWPMLLGGGLILAAVAGLPRRASSPTAPP